MKQKIGFLVAVVGLIILIVLAIRFIGGNAPKQGELKVDSQPVSGVYLDNKHIGRTPIGKTAYNVNAGEYVLKLVPDSTINQLTGWEGKIKVGAGMLTYVDADLSESELTTAVDILWLEKIVGKKAELSVTTTPDSATVLLDDDIKGVTPLLVTDAAVGDHTLTVMSRGLQTRTIKVRLTAGYRLTASVKLALSPGDQQSAQTTPTPAIATSSASPSPSGKTTPTPTGKTSPSPTPKLTPGQAATSSGSSPAKPYVVIKDTPTGFLRVRLEASTTASEVARVRPGEKYPLDSTKTGWYEISYEDGKTGWISGQYADKVE